MSNENSNKNKIDNDHIVYDDEYNDDEEDEIDYNGWCYEYFYKEELTSIPNNDDDDNDYIFNYPWLTTPSYPTLVFDLDVNMHIDSSLTLELDHHVSLSNKLKATISMIVSEFSMKNKACITIAPIIQMLLQYMTSWNTDHWILKETSNKQMWSYEKSKKFSGNIVCPSLILNETIYDELSYDRYCAMNELTIKYEAKIFLSPANSMTATIYKNHGFECYKYEPNNYDEELSQLILDIIQNESVPDTDSIDLCHWYTFYEFHQKTSVSKRKTHNKLMKIEDIFWTNT